MVSQTWWDFNHTFKMGLEGKNIGLATTNENEGGNGEVRPELVDDRTNSPKSNSIQNSKVKNYMSVQLHIFAL